MAIVFALLSALGFGVGDFAGGSAARRTTVATVVAASHLLGLVLVAAAAPLLADRFAFADLGLGAIGGLFGLVGVMLLYRGLAVGPMSVVAPLTAVTSAAVPALWGFATGERPSVLAGVGLAIGLVAIVAVSSEADPAEQADSADSPIGQTAETKRTDPGSPDRVTSTPPGARSVRVASVLSALAAGSGFGAMFIVFDRTVSEVAPWPIVGARMASVGVLAIVVLAGRASFVPPTSTRGLIVITAICDLGGNIAFLLASQRGLLSLVSVVSAMYPVATVTLARLVHNEQVSRIQLIGMVLALTATACIALG